MKTLLIIILSFATTGIYAQKKLTYANLPLNTAEDYANAEKSALQAANEILSLPLDKDSQSKSEAMHFLSDWMQGTPAFLFPLNEPIGKISNDNPELLVIYMASMTRYVLSNETKTPLGEKDIAYHGFLIFSDYCDNPKNHVSINGELKNLIDAKKQGNLQDYLDEFAGQPEGKEV